MNWRSVMVITVILKYAEYELHMICKALLRDKCNAYMKYLFRYKILPIKNKKTEFRKKIWPAASDSGFGITVYGKMQFLSHRI